MVFEKKSGFGFNGYQIPAMARGIRSARGRRLFRDNVEDNQMCAFELLATVAGRLLLERENASPPVSPTCRGSNSPAVVDRVVKEEPRDKVKPVKVEPFYQGSSDETTLTFDQKLAPKEYYSQASSTIAAKSEELPEKHQARRASGSPGSAESHRAKVEEGIENIPMQFKKQGHGNRVGRPPSGDLFCSEDPTVVVGLDAKPPSLVSSDSSAEILPYPSKHNKNSRSCSLPRSRHDMRLLDRDDDENSSGCTHPSTLSSKIYRSHFCVGNGRVRKFSVSKFWKVGPTLLCDESEEKPAFRSRKMFYTRERTQRSSFKRRRLFERGSAPSSSAGVYGKAISKSPAKGLNGETSDSTTNCCPGQKKLPVKSEDYKVKLRIKSFKVPELFVEIPESSTVGSLKRTVLESLTGMLGNGRLRVGVIVQGKKIRDDSKTLLHFGISEEDEVDLGFTLETNPSSTTSLLFPGSEDSHFLEPSGDSPKPLALRLPALPLPTDANPRSQGSHVERDHRSYRPHAKAPGSEQATSESKALVPAAACNGEPMAMVPSPRKPRRTEMAQRRIRRPFSVAEVEALVTAVECLGTGRWRDVKIRAFENVKHRTYVDLKDKWKTLVHTARISPQQRRGEPVPQDLLDRVLQAHAYWSKQQAKLQAKPPPQLLSLPPTQLPALPPTELRLLH